MSSSRPEPSVAELIGRISSRMRQAMGDAFDSADLGGLTPLQARTVGFIEASEGRGLIQKDIADVTGTRPATVSALLGTLERDGWIERRTDPADARRKTLHVTPKARELVKRFEANVWASSERQLDVLDPDERRTLVALLTKLDRHLAG